MLSFLMLLNDSFIKLPAIFKDHIKYAPFDFSTIKATGKYLPYPENKVSLLEQ